MKKPTFVRCYHEKWGMHVEGPTFDDCVALLGCDRADLVVRLNLEGDDALLRDVPVEFKSVLSGMAYDRGHPAGEEECWGILSSLVYDLLPAIQKFEQRIRHENCNA